MSTRRQRDEQRDDKVRGIVIGGRYLGTFRGSPVFQAQNTDIAARFREANFTFGSWMLTTPEGQEERRMGWLGSAEPPAEEGPQDAR